MEKNPAAAVLRSVCDTQNDTLLPAPLVPVNLLFNFMKLSCCLKMVQHSWQSSKMFIKTMKRHLAEKRGYALI